MGEDKWECIVTIGSLLSIFQGAYGHQDGTAKLAATECAIEFYFCLAHIRNWSAIGK